jgi:hypothetical protein
MSKLGNPANITREPAALAHHWNAEQHRPKDESQAQGRHYLLGQGTLPNRILAPARNA